MGGSTSAAGPKECAVIWWSAEEYQAAVDLDLARLGLTLEELAAQALSDEFASDDARRLWFAIKPIGPGAPVRMDSR